MKPKFVFNFLTNTYHKFDSFFCVDKINVVFTEDSKCFPIDENIYVVDSNTFTNSLKKIISKEMILGKLIVEIMIDPDTGEPIKI